jgi:hypothetical protein
MAQLKSLPAMPTIRQSSQRIMDLVAAWKDATPDQRARLVASILSEIQVKDWTVVAVRPRPAWGSYFEELIETLPRERETGGSRASTTSHNRIQIMYRLAAVTA